MWPVAILLIAVVLFYWFSFCLTVIAWLKALAHLCFGNFIRATVWFSIGCGMLFWWFDKDIDFDTWLRGSAAIVGMGMVGSLLLFVKRHSRPTVPAWTPPADVKIELVVPTQQILELDKSEYRNIQ